MRNVLHNHCICRAAVVHCDWARQLNLYFFFERRLRRLKAFDASTSSRQSVSGSSYTSCMACTAASTPAVDPVHNWCVTQSSCRSMPVAWALIRCLHSPNPMGRTPGLLSSAMPLRVSRARVSSQGTPPGWHGAMWRRRRLPLAVSWSSHSVRGRTSILLLKFPAHQLNYDISTALSQPSSGVGIRNWKRRKSHRVFSIAHNEAWSLKWLVDAESEPTRSFRFCGLQDHQVQFVPLLFQSLPAQWRFMVHFKAVLHYVICTGKEAILLGGVFYSHLQPVCTSMNRYNVWYTGPQFCCNSGVATQVYWCTISSKCNKAVLPSWAVLAKRSTDYFAECNQHLHELEAEIQGSQTLVCPFQGILQL